MRLFGNQHENQQRGDGASREGTTTRPGGLHARRDGTGGDAFAAEEGNVASIGKSIVFKGDLSGDEDLQVDGQVEGGIQLANHQLTVGENGRVQAQLYAKSVVVIGQVTGNITATERVEVAASGAVEGDIHTPRLVVAEGAVVNGTIEMTRASEAGTPAPSKAPRA